MIIDESKPRVAFFCKNPKRIVEVYGDGRREQLEELADLFPEIITPENLDGFLPELGDVEAVFSTWGMFVPAAEQLDRLGKLSYLFYAAGSVRGIATPFLERDIQVCSAWAANAVPVAEFVLGQILLSGKGYFRNTRECRARGTGSVVVPSRGTGNFGETVALIGFGMIARKLRELLRAFGLNVLVVDPFLTDQEADQLEVRRVSLETAFREAYVVSNHLPNLPETGNMLNAPLFRLMRPNATFINTGRGAQVNEGELIATLRERPDITALLDVTFPEPPVEGSGFYTLPNVQLSSHIAGSLGNEVVRMADYMIADFKRWRGGLPPAWSVSRDMLDRMA